MIVVIDNFYDDPNLVREFALQQKFDVKGNYPGARTKSFARDNMKERFEQIVGPIEKWPTSNTYNGAFQLSNANDKSWIHQDTWNRWAAVVYLSDRPNIDGGTGFYLNTIVDPDPYKPSHWKLVDRVGNQYNRCVLFSSNQWHTSMEAFDGRLFQVFFFS